jgi:hypothetical protein
MDLKKFLRHFLNNNPEVCTVKPFTAVIVTILLQARLFATAIHFHPSLLYVGKARSLPLEKSPVRGSTQVGFSIACKY